MNRTTITLAALTLSLTFGAVPASTASPRPSGGLVPPSAAAVRTLTPGASPKTVAARPPVSTLAVARAAAPQKPIAPPQVGGERQTMTLEECVRVAHDKHPQLKAAHQDVSKAVDQARAVRGGYLPKLTAEANVIVWDDDMGFSLGGAAPDGFGAPPTADQLPESGFDGWVATQLGGLSELLGGMGDMTLRDQVTWGVTLKAVQPITPLYKVAKGHEARLAAARGARERVKTVRSDIGMEVASAYYASLQADSYVEIAQSAVDQLEAHLKHAKAFYEQGLLPKSDVLTVEVELANAQQQRIQAQSGRIVARANLSVQMGLDPRTPVEPAPMPPSEDMGKPNLPLEKALETAVERRSELREVAHGVKAAGAVAKAEWWDLTPQVVLMAQYDHAGGQGAMALEDTFYGGVALSWDFWDWGTTIYEAKAADAAASSASFQWERLEQLVRLDVTAKYQAVGSAAEAYRVARVAITQAEEALRMQRERFAAQTATSTDVLDAESNLTRARANVTNTWYAWLLAQAELDRAIGIPLTEVAEG